MIYISKLSIAPRGRGGEGVTDNKPLVYTVDGIWIIFPVFTADSLFVTRQATTHISGHISHDIRNKVEQTLAYCHCHILHTFMLDREINLSISISHKVSPINNRYYQIIYLLIALNCYIN